MALSAHFPENGQPNVDHYLIQHSDLGYRVQGSLHFFKSIPDLLVHYHDNAEELPCRLVLPPTIRRARTLQELTSLSYLGQGVCCFDAKVSDLVTLTATFILKKAHLDFVAARGIHVSQTHLVRLVAKDVSVLQTHLVRHSLLFTAVIRKYTVDDINFWGYQFSWFSWRVLSTNSNTHKMVIFCMKYESKYYAHEFLNPTNVLFLFNPRNWYQRR